MKKLRIVVCLLASVLASSLLYAQEPGTCAIYNVGWSSNQSTSDAQEHNTGDHRDVVNFTGSCSYSGNNKAGACAIQCSETTTSLFSDSEDLTNILYTHVLNDVKTNGMGGSNGPSVTCGGQVAFGVLSCPKVFGCNLTVTINGSVYGLGGSATYNPTSTLFKNTLSYPYICGAQTSPGCILNQEPTYPPDGQGGNWEWNPTTCEWVWHSTGNHTPIIIDTDGAGFHLTSAAQGINWDFFGNGKPFQIAWTQAGSTNGWLAIDLNGNGKINSAKELFSNVAPQPHSDNPNGFLALAVYDENHDGVIDSRDSVWPRLLVWIDLNHDGISQPNELHHLGDIGIHSISLQYTDSPLTDAYGNKFHLKGHLNPDKGDDVDRVIYDVYLTSVD